MRKTGTIRIALAIAALGAIGLIQQAGPAQAANNYCAGRLALDSVARTVTSTGSSATVDWTAHLRNTTGSDVLYVINTTRMANTDSVGYHSPAQETLARYNTVLVKFFSQTVQNPSGAGALTQDKVISLMNVFCY